MAPTVVEGQFSELFDRAVASCARAQVLSVACADGVSRALETRAANRRLRNAVAETRQAWSDAGVVLDVMRLHVSAVATRMRKQGVNEEEATAAVRSRVRFVLYDGGLGEREAEPVVERASVWVQEAYAAA